jgi:hypothetical protein
MMYRNMSTLSLKEQKPIDDSEAVLHAKVEGPPILVASSMVAKELVGPDLSLQKW